MEERLHKYLAHCGVASRRKAEEMIRSGEVIVNGEIVTEMGVRIDPTRDCIKVAGRVIKPENHVYYIIHKPRDVTTTTSDEHGRKTVLDLLDDVKQRVYPVGRLDRDSEGLLVLTNDGDMAYYLTHPGCGVMKTYRATVEGKLSPALLEQLVEKGIKIGSARIHAASAKLVRSARDTTIVEVVVREGINREIRRLFAALGHEVKRLVRIRIGPLELKGLGKRQYRRLRNNELAALRRGMKKADLQPGGTASGRQQTRQFNAEGTRPGKPDPAKRTKSSAAGRSNVAKNKSALKLAKKSSKKPEKRSDTAKSKSPAHPLSAPGKQHPLKK